MRVVFVALLFLAACDSAVQPPSMLEPAADGGVEANDRGVEANDAGVVIADASEPIDSGINPWAPVEALLEQRQNNVALGLVVFDQNDQRVFEKTYNGFTTAQNIAVASASKMISGLVIFALIDRGLLTLDSTTGDVLGWTDAKSSITLRHLLSFTSGMPADNTCANNARITLADCVDTIAAVPPSATPGVQFEYGPTHLAVAARMAEVVTGKSWKEIFDDELRVPLGLPDDVEYLTAPRQHIGGDNPLIAGGLRASIDTYATMLARVFHGTGANFEAQRREPFDVVIAGSPLAASGYDYRYGLTAWLECATPLEGCDVISSPGAFGFTPFLDRATGYYAILGMEITIGAQFSFPIEQDLEPLIRAALTTQ